MLEYKLQQEKRKQQQQLAKTIVKPRGRLIRPGRDEKQQNTQQEKQQTTKPISKQDDDDDVPLNVLFQPSKPRLPIYDKTIKPRKELQIVNVTTIKPKPALKPIVKPRPTSISILSKSKECKIGDPCLVWQKLTTVYPKIKETIDYHESKRLKLADCGSGQYAVDCGFLAIGAALQELAETKEERNKNLNDIQMDLRRRLWKEVSATDHTLSEFVQFYHTTDGRAFNTPLSNWSSVGDKRKIQIYIMGGDKSKPYNQRFQGDTYALKWLLRDGDLRDHLVRIWVLSLPYRVSGTPPLVHELVSPPIDEFDPILQEQQNPVFDHMNYIILWNVKDGDTGHWQLIGHKNTGKEKALFRYADLPAFLKKENKKNENECSTDPDGMRWTKLAEFDEGKLGKSIQSSFQIQSLWMAGLNRLCISDTGTKDDNDLKRLGQLFLPLYQDNVTESTVRRCEIANKMQIDDNYTSLLKDTTNWQFATSGLRKQWMTNLQSITDSKNVSENERQKQLMALLQWKIVWHQPTFRKQFLSRYFPFDDTKSSSLEPGQLYEAGSVVYITLYSGERIYYRLRKRGTAPTDRNELYKQATVFRLVALQDKTNTIYSYQQAIQALSLYEIPENQSIIGDVQSVNPACEVLQKYRLASNEQYLWNFEEIKLQTIREKLKQKTDTNNNQSRLNFIRAMITKINQDDSFFKLNGPWASRQLYLTILADLRTRFLSQVTDVGIVDKLISIREAWIPDEKDGFSYEDDIVDEFKTVTIGEERVLKFRTILSDPSTQDEFLLSSSIALSLLVNALQFQDDKPDLVRHFIIFRQVVRNGKYQLVDIQSRSKPTPFRIDMHRFAIWIQRFEKDKNNKWIRKWYLLSAPPTDPEGQGKGSRNSRWLVTNALPAWLAHTLFTEQELMTFPSQ